MNEHSEKHLSQVHPELARRVRRMIGRLASVGVTVEVVQGLRSFEVQNRLYEQGRSAPGKIVTNAYGGQSNHNFGLAVDLCPFVGGKPCWEAPADVWAQIGNEAERHGLEWGGNWAKFVDRPHVQLSTMSVAQCRALYDQGGLPLVWARATASLQAVESHAPASVPRPQAITPTLPTGAAHGAVPNMGAWSVTVPTLKRTDSSKSLWAVLIGGAAQVFAAWWAWWQRVDWRLVYVVSAASLLIITLAYLWRQTRLGEAREAKEPSR